MEKNKNNIFNLNKVSIIESYEEVYMYKLIFWGKIFEVYVHISYQNYNLDICKFYLKTKIFEYASSFKSILERLENICEEIFK